jgi:hypothetical protein
MRVIWKVTSGELLAKQVEREKLNYHIQKGHTYSSCFSIEALVISMNKFLYACVKEVCRL